MNTKPAKKLTIYVDETDKVKGRPVYEAVMDICFRNRVSGVSVFRGVAGYGRDRVVHTAKILELSTSLPVKIEIVEAEAVIESMLPEITAIVTKGLVEISETLVVDRREPRTP